MSAPRRNLLITVVVLAVLIGGGFYIKQYGLSLPGSTSGLATTSIPVEGGTLNIVGKPGETYTVTEQSGGTALKAPDYKIPLTFDASISADVQTTLNANLKEIQKELSANPQDFNAWITLGGIYKLADMYTAAASVWEYTSVGWPKNTVSYNNLGDLYMNFLKDYPKAETNYKMLISLDPTSISSYENLFYLYRDLYKTNTTSAKDILELGLKNNPGNGDLQALLTGYTQTHA